MARALKNSDIDPTYLDFFGMTRPPFSQLSGPSQIFHSEQYSLLMAHLASATKQSDCLLVVCGADGSGKTTLLNRYITSLNDETSFATFDETCADGAAFYCAFLRQLGFHDITGKLRELRRITKEFLIHRGKAHDPVLLIMDNAHLVSPTVLEQLRWISETKVEDRRVLSIVLAGNADLARIMDSPAMRVMKFRDHINFNIRVYSQEETEDYVRHRLRLAGGVDAAKFSSEAHPLIYSYSGGIPSVINMLCNGVLAEACACETRVISEDLIRTVADRHQLKSNVFDLAGKGRRKTDPGFKLELRNQPQEERIAARAQSAPNAATSTAGNVASVAQLHEHIARLKAQLVALRAENQQAQLDIAARDKKVAEVNAELAEQTQVAGEMSTNLGLTDELRQQLAEKTRQCEELARSVAGIDDLRAQLSARTEENRQLAESVAEIDDLRGQLTDEIQKNSELAAIAADVEDLRAQLADESTRNSELSAIAVEVDDLRDQLAAKSRDSEQLSSTTAEIDVLRKQLDAKSSELGRLTREIDDNAEEIERLHRDLSDRNGALSESKEAVKSLSTDLRDEKAESKKARADADKAEKRIEKLERKRDELQQSVKDLNADLKLADKREKELANAEKKAEALHNQMEENALLVASQTSLIAELEEALISTREENKALRESADAGAPGDLQELLSEKDLRIEILEAELASYSHLHTSTQPQLDDEPVAAPVATNEPDESADFGRDASIKAIEIIKDGDVVQIVQMSKMPSRIMVGRSEDSELCLNSKFVSRHHALIFYSAEGIYIEDLNSFNGTLVNAKKIVRCELHPEDKVIVGDYQLRPL